MTATDGLNRALLSFAAAGDRPRCSDPITRELWTAEFAAHRAIAVKWCKRCPVLVLCRQAAEERDERFGVCGGVDRSIRPGRKSGVTECSTTVPGVLLNGNQTISVKQSLCTFHVCLGSGQVPSEQLPCRHGVTISSGIAVVRPDSSTQDSLGLTRTNRRYYGPIRRRESTVFGWPGQRP